ncbi:MAG TPA: PrsW family intramembrane metalloprotease [Ktedonobacterales bacterium]
MSARICPHCGSPNSATDERCRVCGWLLVGQGAPVPMRASTAQGPQPPGPPPGYPAYPYPQYPPNPYAQYPQSPYPYYPPYAQPYQRPKRAKGEIYALVVSWIVTVLGGISALLGTLVVLIGVLALTNSPDSLATVGAVFDFGLVPVVGGILALIVGIRGILRRQSPVFALPSWWLFLGLAILAITAGVVLWNINPSPGLSYAVMPLVVLSGALPALALFALASSRLASPATQRHIGVSMLYGMTLAPLLAIILEVVAAVLIVVVLRSLGHDVSNTVLNNSFNFQDPVQLVAALLEISVTAAVVEELVKPLGALLIMPRLRTKSEAFLVGMAAGIGFNIVETVGYITGGQADWISIAIERVDAGLLHGVGAGMGALGFWYLINGKGESHRWLKGLGALAYAIAQHAINNGGAVLISALPAPLSTLLNQTLLLGRLPVQAADFVFFAYGGLILVVFLIVTSRLRRSQTAVAGGAA